MVGVLPGLDALDDEEVLAGTDVAEPPRLARERIARRRSLNPFEQRALLRREPGDLGLTGGELVTRLEPAPQRMVVRVADQDDQQDGEPAPSERGEDSTLGQRRGCDALGGPGRRAGAL